MFNVVILFSGVLPVTGFFSVVLSLILLPLKLTAEDKF